MAATFLKLLTFLSICLILFVLGTTNTTMKFSAEPMIPRLVKSELLTQYPDMLITHFQENSLNTNEGFVVYGKRGKLDLKIIFDPEYHWRKTIYWIDNSNTTIAFDESTGKKITYTQLSHCPKLPRVYSTAIRDFENRTEAKRMEPFFEILFREEKLKWHRLQANIQLSLKPQQPKAISEDFPGDN
jgi:hypothetical protein